MSYDLFVFDPEVAPKTLAELTSWYEAQTESDEFSTDPSVLTPRLQAWFREMTVEFPALNGPAAPVDIEDRVETAGDYSMQPGSVSVNFGWSQASRAGTSVFASAERNRLGLYDPQARKADDGWYLPVNGKLVLLKREKQGSFMSKLRSLVSRE